MSAARHYTNHVTAGLPTTKAIRSIATTLEHSAGAMRLGSGWNGPPARSRRQLAAELRQGDLANQMVGRRRTQSGGRVARRNGPVARSNRNPLHGSGSGGAE